MAGKPVVLPAAAAGLTRGKARSALGLIITLFKLRVVLLLLFAAVGGAVLAAGSQSGLNGWDMLLLLITGGMSAAGASALNQYLERERDGLMQRTRRRPLVEGALRQPWWALAAGLGLVGLATLIALPFNVPLAFFNTLGAAMYVGVYTLWLKPRTLLNIVIGGAAGSCAVLSGGAAAGSWSDAGVWLLALLVFAWTPTHFWSLALAYRDDYAQADVPMLPVHTSPRRAAGWILLHTALTGLAALALATRPGLGVVYLLTAALATLWLWRRSVQLLAHPARQTAIALFVFSNAYLGLILLAICAQVLF
ncbi:MAG: heme o synthase [Chloroflexota bacterium]